MPFPSVYLFTFIYVVGKTNKTNGILFFMKNLGGGTSVRGFIFS